MSTARLKGGRISIFKQWISQLEPARVARTREEHEAVYRFRYDVYYRVPPQGSRCDSEEHAPERVTPGRAGDTKPRGLA